MDSKTYTLLIIIDEKTFSGSVCPKIRSICISNNERMLYVGTYGSEIFELSTKDPKIGNNTVFIPKILITGHYTPNQLSSNEVWGL